MTIFDPGDPRIAILGVPPPKSDIFDPPPKSGVFGPPGGPVFGRFWGGPFSQVPDDPPFFGGTQK